MSVQEQIDKYIADQPEAKREDMRELHMRILGISPNSKTWFLDGRNSEGKVVSNPNIGYGTQANRYANGEVKEFYRVGVSANTAGISIYLMSLKDKKYLFETYGNRLGKAKITGYCVKFKHLKDLNKDVLEEMIRGHMDGGSALGS